MVGKMNKHGGNLQEFLELTSFCKGEIVDFSANINPLGPPEYFRSVLCRNLSGLLHYPDPECSTLVARVVERYGIDPRCLIIGNGTSELIFALPRILAVTKAIIPVPSYIDYTNAARLAGLEVQTLLLSEDNDFQVDWRQLSESLSGGELVFLGQPNNPTGQLFDSDIFLETAKNNPKTIFIVDEAFADFIEAYEAIFSQDLAHNIIVLKSLTKFYAIPGLRLGLAVAPPRLAQKIRQHLSPWSVNSLALALGEEMIVDRSYGAESRAMLKILRQEFVEMLLQDVSGLKVFNSTANFLLVKIVKEGLDAVELRNRLLKKGLAIRVCDNFIGLGKQFFRLAVRRREENIRMSDELAEILGQPKVVAGKKKILIPPKRPALMFQGAGSDVGKSILAAGLCRVLLQDGVRVAPFKSQNMSLNSFVTRDGGEMGRAQVVQAQACHLDPDVRMNPVLLKPSSDVGSQVIINGKPVANMVVEEYLSYKPTAFAAAQKAYDSLAEEHDVIILEGAGSPAEVNLKRHDIVNMNMARYAKSPVILIGDIDRGGVFASLIGTMDVLTEWERELLAGFVINRFRGRESLLGDAFTYTTRHTGKPFFGVIPYLQNLCLPEEDSVGFKKGLFQRPKPLGDFVEVVLIDLPHISNFTDFEPFLNEPDVWMRTVSRLEDLGAPDLVILPGSKNVMNDLHFLKSSGLTTGLRQLLAGAKCEIIGVCGGFQMLGQSIADPYAIEGGGELEGLGFLDLGTVLAREKTLKRLSFRHIASDTMVHGYEIHHGQTPASLQAVLMDDNGQISGAATVDGRVWGTYLHGMFDSDPFRYWLVEKLRQRKGFSQLTTPRPVYDLEPAFDRLADVVRERLDMKKIYELLGL